MPKAGFDRDSLYAPSGRGFVEVVDQKRLGEVVSCVSRFHQWQANKKTGAQTAPLTAVFLTIAEIDAAGTRVAEPVEQELVVEWGPKDDSMIKVRPGLADSRDGDAADTLDENGQLVLGTEGNCLFVEEGTKISMRQAFGNFVLSCQDHGFKPEILGAGFLPDLVGLRAWFNLKAGKKKDGGITFNDFVVDSIIKFPYEKTGAGAGAGAGKPATKAATGKPAAAAASGTAKVNGAPKPAVAAAPVASTDSSDVEAICIDIMKKVSVDVAASGNAELPRQKLIVMALQKVIAPNSGIAKTMHKAIQDTLKSVDWFETNGVSFGAVNSGDDKYMMVGAD